MLTLRSAEPEDERLVLMWRNEASTRAASLNAGEISPERHHDWFARKLDNPSCALLIVEEDGRPVGQVRLDRVAPNLAQISIGLVPDARGRGLGREILGRSMLEAERLLAVTRVSALVKRDNAASLAAFRAAGFHVVAENDESVELLCDSRVGPSTG